MATAQDQQAYFRGIAAEMQLTEQKIKKENEKIALIGAWRAKGALDLKALRVLTEARRLPDLEDNKIISLNIHRPVIRPS